MATSGTFWQVLAQFSGLLGTADPLQTWAGLSILSTSLGWEVSWLTSFPSNVILCFSAVLPIWRVLSFHYLTEYPEQQLLPPYGYLSVFTNGIS